MRFDPPGATSSDQITVEIDRDCDFGAERSACGHRDRINQATVDEPGAV